ncbi:MAG: hypothetical protein E6J90_41245, partial [Deltaproteobacteria bacterium]
VRHSGIVEVYDFGFLEDRTAYIVMEYLEGESLAARLRRGRPTIAVTLTIVRAVSRALQAAHDQGIVHRDLKPDNVFLVPEPELPSGERVKILDFGIAKLAHSVGEANHTQTGTVMGTPTYMSPEQCRGAGPVDHRADLYSLGCVVYEMLCGQPPFVADGPGVVIGRHLHIEPQPPRSHRSDIPAEVEEIVLTLLKKEPRDRYRNAADLVRAIDQLATVTPPAAAPGKPVPTELVATLPMVKEKTTLNGAASSREVSKRKVARSSVTLLAAAVTSVIAFLVVILFLARGGRDGEIGSSTAPAPLAVEPSGSGSAVYSATPETTGPMPPVAPGAAAEPSINPRSSVDGSQPTPSQAHSSRAGEDTVTPSGEAATAPAAAMHSDGSGSNRTAGPNLTATTPPPDVTKPTAPSNPAPVAPSSGVATPGGPVEPSPRQVSGARPTSTARGLPDDSTSPSVATSREGSKQPRKTTTAAKRAPPANPKVEPTSSETKTPGESTDPTEFPKWNKTLTPIGSDSGQSTGGKVRDATKTSDAVKPGPSADATAAPRPSESPSTNAPTGPSDSECTEESFVAVLNAKTSSRTAVKAAVNRLKRCKPKMDSVLYEDIHRRLINIY